MLHSLMAEELLKNRTQLYSDPQNEPLLSLLSAPKLISPEWAVCHYLAWKCLPVLVWPAHNTPTALPHPARSGPGLGRAHRKTCGWPGRSCSRAGLPSTGRAAYGRGRCASLPALPRLGWRVSGHTVCGLPSCARAGGHC